MLSADELLRLLHEIRVLPRRMLLETPGVAAAAPMLRGVWGAALYELDSEAYQTVFAPQANGLGEAAVALRFAACPAGPGLRAGGGMDFPRRGVEIRPRAPGRMGHRFRHGAGPQPSALSRAPRVVPVTGRQTRGACSGKCNFGVRRFIAALVDARIAA